ncbi:MAG: hypothetical protein KAU41_05015, partial [Deltaproteobacteria bacterium]|nr:hypothetical protein [Deltaproteobacteria bacterium]
TSKIGITKEKEVFNRIFKKEQTGLILFGERARATTLRPFRTSCGTILGLSLNSGIWIRDDRRLETKHVGY